MRYEMQHAQKMEGRKRRDECRRQIRQFVSEFREREGRDPIRSEIAAHFHRSTAWLGKLLALEEKDQQLEQDNHS